jgi:hypothetical protein
MTWLLRVAAWRSARHRRSAATSSLTHRRAVAERQRASQKA